MKVSRCDDTLQRQTSRADFSLCGSVKLFPVLHDLQVEAILDLTSALSPVELSMGMSGQALDEALPCFVIVVDTAINLEAKLPVTETLSALRRESCIHRFVVALTDDHPAEAMYTASSI